jgi:hypothetical protein
MPSRDSNRRAHAQLALVAVVQVLAIALWFSTGVNTALTAQLAIGFAITAISIGLVPLMAQICGWYWGLVVPVVGPIVRAMSARLLWNEPSRLGAPA